MGVITRYLKDRRVKNHIRDLRKDLRGIKKREAKTQGRLEKFNKLTRD